MQCYIAHTLSTTVLSLLQCSVTMLIPCHRPFCRCYNAVLQCSYLVIVRSVVVTMQCYNAHTVSSPVLSFLQYSVAMLIPCHRPFCICYSTVLQCSYRVIARSVVVTVQCYNDHTVSSPVLSFLQYSVTMLIPCHRPFCICYSTVLQCSYRVIARSVVVTVQCYNAHTVSSPILYLLQYSVTMLIPCHRPFCICYSTVLQCSYRVIARSVVVTVQCYNAHTVSSPILYLLQYSVTMLIPCHRPFCICYSTVLQCSYRVIARSVVVTMQCYNAHTLSSPVLSLLQCSVTMLIPCHRLLCRCYNAVLQCSYRVIVRSVGVTMQCYNAHTVSSSVMSLLQCSVTMLIPCHRPFCRCYSTVLQCSYHVIVRSVVVTVQCYNAHTVSSPFCRCYNAVLQCSYRVIALSVVVLLQCYNAHTVSSSVLSVLQYSVTMLIPCHRPFCRCYSAVLQCSYRVIAVLSLLQCSVTMLIPCHRPFCRCSIAVLQCSYRVIAHPVVVTAHCYNAHTVSSSVLSLLQCSVSMLIPCHRPFCRSYSTVLQCTYHVITRPVVVTVQCYSAHTVSSPVLLLLVLQHSYLVIARSVFVTM